MDLHQAIESAATGEDRVLLVIVAEPSQGESAERLACHHLFFFPSSQMGCIGGWWAIGPGSLPPLLRRMQMYLKSRGQSMAALPGNALVCMRRTQSDWESRASKSQAGESVGLGWCMEQG